MSQLATAESVPLFFDFKDSSDLVFFVLHILQENLLIIECDHEVFVNYFKSNRLTGAKDFSSVIPPKPNTAFDQFFNSMKRAVNNYLHTPGITPA